MYLSDRAIAYDVLESPSTEKLKIKKTKGLNTCFSKKDIQITSKCMKRCSASSTIKEMEIKTIVTYYFIPIRMAVSIFQIITSVGEDMK